MVQYKSQDQVYIIREIKRSKFTIEEEIGKGNFGKVHRGQLMGLHTANSKTPVAIKSIHSDGNEKGGQD